MPQADRQLLDLRGKEDKVLAKLDRLAKRRAYHEWRLGDLDRQIGEETRKLAAARGVAFIRDDTIRLELAERAAAPKKEAQG